jgi:hypothetical protein
MDWVHDFGSCVYGIVDQSRTLILIWAARILLKWKGIGDIILALHHWAGGSQRIGREGWRTGSAWWHHRGLPELCPRVLRGTVTRGFWGKMMHGSTVFLSVAKRGRGGLQDGSRQRLPCSKHERWRGAAPTLFRLQEVVQRLPRGLLLLLGRFDGSNQWRIAEI